ncbi:unnamed protein product, partial [Dovyalis caffra]
VKGTLNVLKASAQGKVKQVAGVSSVVALYCDAVALVQDKTDAEAASRKLTQEAHAQGPTQKME